MLGFLVEVPTEHLHTITFHISVSEGFDLERAEEFDCLASQIEGERFKQLQVVRFVHDGPVLPKDLRIGLQTAFGVLYSRDALRIVEDC